MVDISIKKVRKRDGRLADFEQEKITEAIWNAAQAVGGKDRKTAEELSDKVVKQLEQKFKDKIPNVENIQDIVEKMLIEEGHAKTAKVYILYREKHKEIRDVKKLLLDSQEIVRDYIAKEDWRVYENANVSYNFSGLLWHSAGTIMAPITGSTQTVMGAASQFYYMASLRQMASGLFGGGGGKPAHPQA